MRRCRRLPPADARSAAAISSARPSGKRSRRPMTLRRAPFSIRRASSARRECRSSAISALTSFAGRRQLSEEKANSVSVATPKSGAASTTRRAAATPAGWPAERGRPRRVAQRPLPSMIMATCRPACPSTVLCIAKLPCKKFSDQLETAQAERGGAGPGGAGGVAHDLLQHAQIAEIAPTTLGGDPADGLRPVVIVTLLDLDQPGVLEHLQMPAEVAVGQPAQLLQVAEHQALGMADQRGEHAQARLLVNDTVEPRIGEAAAVSALAISLRHPALRCCDREPPPCRAGRCRTAPPSRRARTHARRWPRRGWRGWRRDTRPRRRTSAGAATGMRRRCRG